MIQKQKQESQQLVEINAGQLYVVEKIVGRKTVAGKIYYKIKWLNYPSQQNTWEPIQNLESVSYMIQEYETRIQNQKRLKNKEKIIYSSVEREALKKLQQKTNDSVIEKQKPRQDKEISIINKNQFETRLMVNQQLPPKVMQIQKKVQQRQQTLQRKLYTTNFQKDKRQTLKIVQRIKRVNNHLVIGEKVFYEVEYEKSNKPVRLSSQQVFLQDPKLLVKYFENKVLFSKNL